MVRIARTLVAVSLALAACGTATSGERATLVAVYGVEAIKPTKLKAARLRALREGLAQILLAVRGWRALPRESLEQAIASSGKRKGRAARTCSDAPCQVKVGRALSATHALAARVEGNLLGQCDLYVALYDLARSGRDRRAHVRAGCGDQALQLSAARALCQVLREDAAADGGELDGGECLAAAELAWPEDALERRLAEESLELKRAYDRVISLSRGRWAVSASCRQGTIYEAFAAALAGSVEEAEPPDAIRRQGSAAVASHRATLRTGAEEKLGPLRAQAQKHYAACLQQADAHRLSTRFIEEARQRVAAPRR